MVCRYKSFEKDLQKALQMALAESCKSKGVSEHHNSLTAVPQGP